ncbi:hypothetical protein SPSYN_02007 [Sporotomaculum syntrophicum]|uniref:Uncharacterized protein n=1 Tax=Sporotomaculum syntrophicum TaxID=182264 RepID=A0A9D3AXA7_9FIRM|nr:hypothetical protein [Sporotomaculum syntrophicum]KAF1084837.1 hypothetical protein SPSYN_02007 [Sporotomaculum syntrophicum]
MDAQKTSAEVIEIEHKAHKIVTICGKTDLDTFPFLLISKVFDKSWERYEGSMFCALGAVYLLGYINGKREERLRRRKG